MLLLPVDVQLLLQNHHWKAIFPPLNYLSTFVWVYFWVIHSVPLICVFIPLPTPYNLELGQWIPTILFFFRFFSLICYYKILSIIPCAIQYFLLIIYFIYSSVYMLIPNFYFIPPPLSLLVTRSLFSMSVGLFLFCK